jgi:hypothetical protein
VKVTWVDLVSLAFSRQDILLSVRLGSKPLKNHDQNFL